MLRLCLLIFSMILVACNPTKPEAIDEPIISPPIISTPRVSPPATTPVPAPTPAPIVVDVIGFKQQTYASWYQAREHGIITASGEVYDYYGMTAAHRNLPLGSLVRIHYPRNNNAVTVRINDRINTEGIKLSAYAAEILGVTRDNRPLVNVEGLSR